MSTSAEPATALLSVIVPVYNAEAFIGASLRDLISYLAASGRDVELIVVDDGSTDRTVARARDAIAGVPIPVHLVESSTNRGKGAAVRRGMQLAQGRYRVFLDADLAYPPTEIEPICATLQGGADVAIASRVHAGSRYIVSPSFFRYLYTRHLAGRLFSWLVRLLLLPGIRDSQAGLKGFTDTAARLLFSGWLPNGFSFDLALLFRARQLGLKVEQVPVLYRYDSEPTTVRFLIDTFVVLRDLLQIRLRLAWPRIAEAKPSATGSAPRRHVAPLAALQSPTARAVLLGLIGFALIALFVSRLALPQGLVAVGAWVVALTAFALLAMRSDHSRSARTARIFQQRGELWLLALIVGVGAFLRLAWLDDVPPMVHVDTAECGLRGLALLHGEASDLFDFSPWYMTPYLSFLPYAASFAVNGLSIFGLRLPSAILGIVAVVPLYVLVRTWFGWRPAALAAVLYTVSHAAIHFSRIGLWNIQVLFHAVTAFAFLSLALQRGSAFHSAAAGIFSGLGLYSYTAGRLIPIVAVVFLGTQLVRRRAARCAAYYGAALLLTAYPLLLNYVKDPDVLRTDRTASVSVFAEINQPHVHATLGTSSTGGILWEQVKRTLEGFVTLGDTSSQYGTTQPLLSPITALLFAIGLFVALRRIGEPGHLLLVVWLGLGLLLGSVLIINPPSYTRLIILFPVPLILAALGLEALLRAVSRRVTLRSADVAIVYLLLIAQSAAFNLVGYYKFNQEMRVVPREWDVLKVLDQFKGTHDYYLFTGPFLFADSPIFRLFSTGTRAVSGFSETDLPRRLARDVAFVVTPEYQRIGLAITERYPGVEKRTPQQDGVTKAFIYRCTADNGCRRTG